MSNLPEAAKYNNRILKILGASSISNDELMAVTRHLDKLTSLALRAADIGPADTTDMQLDTLMNGTKWTDDR